MPEARLQRARGTLPEGYQFGDGALFGLETRLMLTRIRAREARDRDMEAYRHSSNARLLAAADAADRDDDERDERAWRAPHLNAAERLNPKCASAVQQGGSAVSCDCQRTGEEPV